MATHKLQLPRMTTARRRLACAVLACGVLATPVQGQVTWFPAADLRAATRQASGADGGRSLELAPALTLRAGGASALLRGDGVLRPSGLALRSAEGEGAAALRRTGLGVLAAELRASYESADRAGDPFWRTDAALLLRRGRAGAGLIAGLGALGVGDRERTVVAPTGRVGAWLRARGITAGAELLLARIPLATDRVVSRDSMIGGPTPPLAPSDTMPGRASSPASVATTPTVLSQPEAVVRQSPALIGELRLALAARRTGTDVDGAAGVRFTGGRCASAGGRSPPRAGSGPAWRS